MRTLIAVGVLMSTIACVRAHTPDGKVYSCLRHTKPIADSNGPFRTLWVGNTQYSCAGPQHDMPDRGALAANYPR